MGYLIATPACLVWARRARRSHKMGEASALAPGNVKSTQLSCVLAEVTSLPDVVEARNLCQLLCVVTPRGCYATATFLK